MYIPRPVGKGCTNRQAYYQSNMYCGVCGAEPRRGKFARKSDMVRK